MLEVGEVCGKCLSGEIHEQIEPLDEITGVSAYVGYDQLCEYYHEVREYSYCNEMYFQVNKVVNMLEALGFMELEDPDAEYNDTYYIYQGGGL